MRNSARMGATCERDGSVLHIAFASWPVVQQCAAGFCLAAWRAPAGFLLGYPMCKNGPVPLLHIKLYALLSC